MWAGKDSNLGRLSQQIYSLPRLTASVPALLNFPLSREQDSNPRPAVYKTAALPAELSRHVIFFVLKVQAAPLHHKGAGP
ncbi:MAG: hypothetical protein US42_C0006G0027 [Candidatus Magasanikbacteria bacterium GW2011_GWC2_37_14]|uniref:Uncharacterized protein n=1 Tax=Candidatus Magasanikbacteria bacterium GW2011_GWC2_37_14 TaxID=1619046 RepID=A0A0G0GNI1_9BACT|nr:MAG: hypothetical protein US42_C0006G0027 [Candidatus Magasanikbacteria bacterium GW2011_GWC2_37_14]